MRQGLNGSGRAGARSSHASREPRPGGAEVNKFEHICSGQMGGWVCPGRYARSDGYGTWDARTATGHQNTYGWLAHPTIMVLRIAPLF